MQIFLFLSQLGKTNALFGGEKNRNVINLKDCRAIFLKTSAVGDHQYIPEQWSFTRDDFTSEDTHGTTECVDVGGSGGTAHTKRGEPRHAVMHRTVPQPKKERAPSVSSTGGEKSLFQSVVVFVGAPGWFSDWASAFSSGREGSSPALGSLLHMESASPSPLPLLVFPLSLSLSLSNK